MTTKTIDDHETMSATALDDEYRALALRVSRGDVGAEKQLAQVEARRELIQRTEKRRSAALVEENRLEAEAQRQASLHAHAKNVADYEVALEAKTRAFDCVQQVVEDLVSAVKLAIVEGNEAHAAALRLGYSPGQLASGQIANYLAWRLGRDGADCAGLSDQMPIPPGLRVPLVAPKGN